MSQVSDSWALVAPRERSGSSDSDETSANDDGSAPTTSSSTVRHNNVPRGRSHTVNVPGHQNRNSRIRPSSEAYENPIFTITAGAGGDGSSSSGTNNRRTSSNNKANSRRADNMVNGAMRLDAKSGMQQMQPHDTGIFHGGSDPHPIKTRAKRGRSYIPTLTTMRALIIKNFISMFRHLGALTFEIILPPFQIMLFCLTLYNDPQNLAMSVFNEEANYTTPFNASCDALMYSCDLVGKLRSDIIKPRYYRTLEEANNAVVLGESWGSIHIKKNFSSALIDRVLLGIDTTNETIDMSRVDVRLDMTNQQVGFILTRELMLSFQSFFQDALNESGYNTELASLPLNMAEPIFGDRKPKYTEFVAPGMLVMITFFMALGLTAMAFVLERKQGLIYRSYVAGVKNVEVLICYMVAQISVLIIQIILTLVVMLLAFEVPNRGSVWVISLLCFVQGICGMSFGLLLSSMFNDETSTIVACLGVFLPCLLLSGMCWPREGMLPVLRYISAVLPQTFGTDALRAVMSRGYALDHYSVYMGVVVPSAWTVLQMGLCGVATHLKEGF